jgi:phosphoglycerol transferase
VDTFPLSNVDAVLFTLFAGTNEGSEEFVISSFLCKVLYPSFYYFALLWVLQAAFASFLVQKKWFLGFSFFRFKFVLGHKGWSRQLARLQQAVLVAMFVICCCHLLLLPGIVFSTPFKALLQRPVDSELYRIFYVHPDSAKVDASSDSLKNVVVIFVESLESNFAKWTPEINAIRDRSVDFPPGGVNVAGTSWTIAGITGKLCGIPLNMPMGINEYHGKLPTYLPHAKCLMDLLADKGYNQLYMQGSSGDFTQKRAFWTTHGNVAVHDIEYYKGKGKIPEDYYVFWGFEDRKLYDFAKEELDSLARLGKPFALYLLTVDTHQPEGYLDDSCATQIPDNGKKYPRALHCASRQLDSFISWAKAQSWYGNTVISVMGDHSLGQLSEKADVPVSDTLYWVSFLLNSSVAKSIEGRRYSSLDMFPTLLEAMGFSLEGHAIGLGRSLFANRPTALEHYGVHILDSLLRERSFQYDYFLFGK